MPREIWKYPLPLNGKIRLPERSQILSLATQSGVPMIWAIVNTEAEYEDINLIVQATGEEIDGVFGPFIGTFQIYSGELVYHVFHPRVEDGVAGGFSGQNP